MEDDHVVPEYQPTSPPSNVSPPYSPTRSTTYPEPRHPEGSDGWIYSPTDSCAHCNSLESQLSVLRAGHNDEMRQIRSECEDTQIRENELRHRCCILRREKRELQTSLDEALASLKMYRARVNPSIVCFTCQEADVDGCFVPCGHQVSCQDCAMKTDKCLKCDRTADFIKDHILLKMR